MNLSSCDDLTSYSESNTSVRSDKSDKRLLLDLLLQLYGVAHIATSDKEKNI